MDMFQHKMASSVRLMKPFYSDNLPEFIFSGALVFLNI